MTKSGNDERDEVRMKLMGLGKNSMRKNYYRELLDRQALLEERNAQLEKEIIQRREAESKLIQLNDELEERVLERTAELEASIDELQKTQAYLLQTERLAALGSLVAGISHEINTPLGIGVTSSSYLIKLIDDLIAKYEEGKLSKSGFEEDAREMKEMAEVLHNNLERGVELLENFKQVAIDQSHYEYRKFNVYSYFERIISNLKPELKKRVVQVQLHCDEELEIGGYPGVFSQILSNLIMNSLLHGFEDNQEGHVIITFEDEGMNYTLKYQDDGRGMSEKTIRRIFDPFYTTRMGSGGSGLGMYIVHNLVTNLMSGTISVASREGEGVQFLIRYPKIHNMV